MTGCVYFAGKVVNRTVSPLWTMCPQSIICRLWHLTGSWTSSHGVAGIDRKTAIPPIENTHIVRNIIVPACRISANTLLGSAFIESLCPGF